jgi:hypothetical protein
MGRLAVPSFGDTGINVIEDRHTVWRRRIQRPERQQDLGEPLLAILAVQIGQGRCRYRAASAYIR